MKYSAWQQMQIVGSGGNQLKHANETPAVAPLRPPAAERAQRTPLVADTLSAAFQESPRMVTQRAMNAAIQASTRMESQRQHLQSLFGPQQTHRGSNLGPEVPYRGSDPLQRRPASETGTHAEPQQEATFAAPAGAAPQAERPNATGLPDALKTGVESLSGMSLDAVKVHYNSAQPAQLNALAYAQGRDIHLAPGQEKHLPHEAWHVVQQAQGRVRPTSHLTGAVPVNDDAALENEANVMGARANASPMQLVANRQALLANLQMPLPMPQAAVKVVQRTVVTSYWLLFDRTQREKTVTEATEKEVNEAKKKELHNQPKIFTSQSLSGSFTLCEDSTNSGYRDSAEATLGPVEPLNVLGKWGVISRDAEFMKAHLIGAEFGGQQKYKSAENIRFHPRELEYGEWQQAENEVKNGGDKGILIVRSSESRKMWQLINGLLSVIADDQELEAKFALIQKLTDMLKAATYVPESVEFSYKDIGGGRDVQQTWKNQDKSLVVSGGKKEVYGALQDLGIAGDLKISEEVKKETSKPEVEINSSKRLYEFLSQCCHDKKFGRRKAVLQQVMRFKKQGRGGDLAFAKELMKLPEVKQANCTVNVTGDFQNWLSVDTIEEWQRKDQNEMLRIVS